MHKKPTFPLLLAKVLFSYLLIALLFGQYSYANTDKKQQKQKELTTLQKKIKKLQQTIAVKQSSKSQYVKQLRSIEKNIGQINKQIRSTENEINDADKQIEQLKKEEQTLSARLKISQKSLQKQIYGAYTQGNNSRIQMIFNQEDPTLFQRNLSFYQYFSEQQANLIKSVRQDLALLNQTRNKIETVQQQQKANRKQLIAQKNELKNDRKQRENIVANLDQQLQKQGHQLNTLKEDEETLKNLISSINEIFRKNQETTQKPFHTLKGKLPWPTEGKIRAMYGRLKPLSNLKWQGHMIYAQQGQYVRAVASGRVAYSDWLRGFGNLVIIDHGNGYLSLYGHNQSLFKEAGDKVIQGEIISSAGDSGGIKKSGIYFEIRKKGRPQNPSLWCNRKNRFHT